MHQLYLVVLDKILQVLAGTHNAAHDVGGMHVGTNVVSNQMRWEIPHLLLFLVFYHSLFVMDRLCHVARIVRSVVWL